MGLKREYAEYLRNAGFIDLEIKQFGDAKASDGKAMDIDAIFRSKPFEAMVTSRKNWWRRALEPKSLGGMGLTRDEAYKAIEGYYKQKTKARHDFFQFLKAEYRPPNRIKGKAALNLALKSKSSITHSLLGKYSTPIRRTNKLCGMCGGNGKVDNLEHIAQVCPRCGGSGSTATSH
jgi:hypothetical protein